MHPVQKQNLIKVGVVVVVFIIVGLAVAGLGWWNYTHPISVDIDKDAPSRTRPAIGEWLDPHPDLNRGSGFFFYYNINYRRERRFLSTGCGGCCPFVFLNFSKSFFSLAKTKSR